MEASEFYYNGGFLDFDERVDGSPWESYPQTVDYQGFEDDFTGYPVQFGDSSPSIFDSVKSIFSSIWSNPLFRWGLIGIAGYFLFQELSRKR